SGRTIVAYQYSPLGGPLDSEVIRTLHAAQVPFLLGTSNTMRAIRALAQRRDCWRRAATDVPAPPRRAVVRDAARAWDDMSARAARAAGVVPVAGSMLARSEDEAAAFAGFIVQPVAVKAEAPGLLHKSDIGCVKLFCAGENEVRDAYRAVTAN